MVRPRTQVIIIGSTAVAPLQFNTKLQEWERFYNFERRHGSLDGLTPYERLRQLTTRASV